MDTELSTHHYELVSRAAPLCVSNTCRRPSAAAVLPRSVCLDPRRVPPCRYSLIIFSPLPQPPRGSGGREAGPSCIVNVNTARPGGELPGPGALGYLSGRRRPLGCRAGQSVSLSCMVHLLDERYVCSTYSEQRQNGLAYRHLRGSAGKPPHVRKHGKGTAADLLIVAVVVRRDPKCVSATPSRLRLDGHRQTSSGRPALGDGPERKSNY